MVAVLNTLFIRKIRMQVEGFFNARYVNQILREEGSSTNPASIMLLLNGMITTGLTVYLLLRSGGEVDTNSWLVFGMILGGIAAVLLYFMIVPEIIRFLFRQDRGLSEHKFNFLLIFQVTGLLLIPCTIIASYSAVGKQVFMYVALTVLILVYVYRLIRGVVIGISNRISLIYIILYLCTLEILPIVVIIGLYGDQFHR